MSQNLAARSRDERDRINVDLAGIQGKVNSACHSTGSRNTATRRAAYLLSGTTAILQEHGQPFPPGGQSCIPERAEK